MAHHPAPHRHSTGRKGPPAQGFFWPARADSHLRNRIAHHEPTIAWDLPKHYRRMIEMTGWLCPAADWCEAHSRFLEVYPPERIILRSDDLERS